MSDSIGQLTAFEAGSDPGAYRWKDLEPLWVDAMDQRFQECRSKIVVLDRLARDRGVDRITKLTDVVPLLFAHSAYKSYPDAFIERNRWDRMNLWLSTLSKYPVEGIDLEGVTDADEWIARLHRGGHYAFATSGTSGKNSFLDQSASDVAFANAIMIPRALRGKARRPIFVLGPRHAPNRASASFINLVEKYGREGAVYFLSDEPLRITDLSRMARMRRKIGEGTALPSEIAAFEQTIKGRQGAGQGMLEKITDAILSHLDEPTLIVGLTPQLYSIVEAARAKGIKPGSFHPDTIVVSGGGSKGANLPEDHLQQIREFMGMAYGNITQGYGMQEISTGVPSVEDGRHEWPAWVVPLLLDDSGETLNETRTGVVAGRLALFDVSIDGRWGGIISGDRVTIDYDPSPRGRTAPAVTSIARYSELQGGDDKLTCAGTIESYVRGAIDA